MQASFKLSSIARGCVAAAALTTALAAQAAVQAPLSETVDGALNEPAYGPGGAGNLYEMLPFLTIKGLGTPALPTSVVALNPALSFDYEISGAGTSLMTVEYTITNKSLTESFSDVSFWVIANPDGDQVDFLDRVTEAWGAAAPKDPVRRQTGQFDDIPNLPSAAVLGGGLTDGAPPAACTAAGGCDAVFALQWSTATLPANSSFIVRVGLSDDGQALSTRYLTATSVVDPAVAITLSGTAEVVAVPEPSTWALMGAGVGLLATLARRRRG